MKFKNFFVLSMLLCGLGMNTANAMDNENSRRIKGVGSLSWASLPHLATSCGYESDSDDDLLCLPAISSENCGKRNSKQSLYREAAKRKPKSYAQVKRRISFPILPTPESERNIRRMVPYRFGVKYHFVYAIPIFAGIGSERHFSNDKVNLTYAIEEPRNDLSGPTHVYIQLMKNPHIANLSDRDYAEAIRYILAGL